ncbi:MAG: hypothetical protein GX756_04205 [Clostridiales bacterium]|jgi:hypothetical protein|nr:hypothetical protein [Clostridiales bacterium]
MDLRSNNMLSNLLPLLMNKGDTNSLGAGNNMLAMLLPMLMQRGGASGSSNEILKSLLPMMAGNNPQLAQVLNNFNTGGAAPQEDYVQDDKPIAINPQNIDNKYASKGRRNIDFDKLYPDLDSLDIHTMPKIDDYKKEQPKNITLSSNNTADNAHQNNGNTNNSLMTLLTLMQNLRRQSPSSMEEKIIAVDGIAPPKIKKSLKAILALNNIIKE